jgi:hypothetical protein
VDDVLDAVRGLTEDLDEPTRPGPNGAAFRGTFSGHSFLLMPNSTTRDSYRPVIVGDAAETEQGTRLTIRLKLNGWVVSTLIPAFVITQGYAVLRGPAAGAWVPLAGFGVFHVVMYVIGYLPNKVAIRNRFKSLAQQPARTGPN